MSKIQRVVGYTPSERNLASKSLQLTFVFFTFLIVLSTVVSGQATQWQSYNIHHPIRLDGAPYATILANITVTDPDGIVIVNNSEMTYRSTTLEHNYTLTGTQLSKSGSTPYQYTITATGSGFNDTSTFNLYVTPSGQSGMLGFMFIALIASYGLLFIAIRIEDKAIGMLATFMLFFMGFWILRFGIDIYKNFYTDSFSVVTLGIAVYSTAQLAESYLGLWD